TNSAARIWRKLVVEITNHTRIHLVLMETSPEAVFPSEHRSRLYVSAELALVDFPSREKRGIPQFSLVNRIGCSGLYLLLPEADTGIKRQRRIKAAARRIEAVVQKKVGVAFRPAENDWSKVQVRDTGRLGRRIKDVRGKPRVDCRDQQRPSVLSTKDLFIERHCVASHLGSDSDIGSRDRRSLRPLQFIDGIHESQIGGIETRRR